MPENWLQKKPVANLNLSIKMPESQSKKLQFMQ